MDSLLLILVPLFFSTALVYSIAGFGGGSTYLALLVIFGLPYELIPKIALLCNLVVVSGGLYHFHRAGYVSIQRLLPFVIASIPFAYLGGRLPVSKEIFLLLLGITLALAGLRLLLTPKIVRQPSAMTGKKLWSVGLPLGATLGFISGLVGIGGGIFLSPILYFLGWGHARHIAAAASFFIFVNSLFGLWGQLAKGSTFVAGSEWLLPLALAVFLGGQIGSRLSVGKISLGKLQKVTAALILVVAGRIFWTFL
jgi:uncharacterized protein